MRSDIVPGGIFPDYELPDQTGKLRKLSELQGDDPLSPYACATPHCRKEHEQHLTRRVLPEDRSGVHSGRHDRYPTITIPFRNSVCVGGAVCPSLRTPTKVQKELDIEEYTDPEHNPMIPHTLVLKPGLDRSSYNGYWFWGRRSVIDLCAIYAL